jgi:predicted PurR-regulated permease PerM
MATAQTAHRILIVLAVLAILLVGLVFSPFATALLLAAVLAGALHPWMERLAHGLGGRRALAGGLLTFAVLAAVVVPIGTFAANLVAQAVEGWAWLRGTLASQGVSALLDYLPGVVRSPAERLLKDLPAAIEKLPQAAASHSGEAAAAVGGVLSATGSFLFQSVMMLIALYFLLVDGPRLVAWLAQVVPLKRGQLQELLENFRQVAVAVIVSTIATGAVQALVAFVGYLIVGVPRPVFFALATFLCALIPALGAAVAVVAVALLMLATGHTVAAAFLAGWGIVVVGLVDNVVKPLLMRGGMEIHGAVIFFALLGGLAVFGPIGLVAGPLAVAFMIAVIRIYGRDFG